MHLNFMDIVVLIIMAVSVIFGFRRGFLRTVTGFLSIVLSLILAMTFHPSLSQYLKETSVYDVVYESTASVIYTPDTETEHLSDYGTSGLNLPKSFMKEMQKNIDTAAKNASETIAETVSEVAVDIVSVLLIFFAARLVLFFIMRLAGFLHKLPIIGFGDSLLGALFGFLRGFLIVYILFAFVTFSASVSPDNDFAKAVKESEVAKVMYHHNFLLDFVYKN